MKLEGWIKEAWRRLMKKGRGISWEEDQFKKLRKLRTKLLI